MADVDLVDETFIAAPPEVLAPLIAAPDRWKVWWPDYTLKVFMDRGLEGMRWSVTSGFIGSCEIWLERVEMGTIVHHYLRGVPCDSNGAAQSFPDTPAGWRAVDKIRRAAAQRWKRHIWAFKDDVEGSRAAGLPEPSEDFSSRHRASPV